MKIALHDADNNPNYGNLALMKLSAWHKSKGDEVSWYAPLLWNTYDCIFSSKVFTFKKSDSLLGNVKRGGSGYKIFDPLPDEIEHICPDYSLYNLDHSLGFLTRGCPNKCPWCIVPIKEGNIRPHADVEEFLRHDKVVLMDNNVLASDHGISQIEKLGRLSVKVDFNQGLDARLIDDAIAKRLAKLKWLKPVRLACDTDSQMKSILKAVKLLRWHNVHPVRYFVYCLMKGNVEETIERVKFLKGLYLEPFVQPFIDFDGNYTPTKEQKRFARWVNHTAVFNSVPFEDYSNKWGGKDMENGFFPSDELELEIIP